MHSEWEGKIGMKREVTYGYIRPLGPDKNSDFNVSAVDSDCKGINDFI